MPRGRRDTNEPEIIDAYRSVGCGVAQLEDPDNAGVPDLMVSYPMDVVRGYGETFLVEVKRPGEKLSPQQVLWHSQWPGRVEVAHTAEEALGHVGFKATKVPRLSRVVAQTS